MSDTLWQRARIEAPFVIFETDEDGGGAIEVDLAAIDAIESRGRPGGNVRVELSLSRGMHSVTAHLSAADHGLLIQNWREARNPREVIIEEPSGAWKPPGLETRGG